MPKKSTTEAKEIKRLRKVFENLPPNKLEVAEGLIVQAARLRVRLDELWEDIKINGNVEEFCQSEKVGAYERERPAARLFTATDKNYQAIIKQLVDMAPPSTGKGKLEELMKEE